MKLLTQFCLKQAVIQNELTPDLDLSRLFDLYALGADERRQLKEIWYNDTWESLMSVGAVLLHENYLDAFCTDKYAFGKQLDEWCALENKREALELIETVRSHNRADLICVMEKDDRYSVGLALYYYLKGVSKDVYLPLVRRADAHKDAEATVLLFAFEPDRQEELFVKLSHNTQLLTAHDGSLGLIKEYYQIKCKGGQV